MQRGVAARRPHRPQWPWETVEVKATYDERLPPTGGFERYAGNSGEHNAPWIGRSLRILFVNFARGVGCAMESLGHSLERMATCGALPYYERYFREYAMLDLTRSGCRSSPVPKGRPSLPDADLRYRAGWRRVETTCRGGNVHFMPNGRFDYDLDGRGPVLSTIETWRQPGQQARAVDAGAARALPRASRPTAWAAGSSTGARTCRASATPRSTTTATR